MARRENDQKVIVLHEKMRDMMQMMTLWVYSACNSLSADGGIASKVLQRTG